ncbi:DNA polymerase zeta, partial [Entophlyctis sp. JEL0112]
MAMPPSPLPELNKPLPKTPQSLLNDWYDRIEKYSWSKAMASPSVENPASEKMLSEGLKTSGNYIFPVYPEDNIPTVFSAIPSLYFGAKLNSDSNERDLNDNGVLDRLSQAFEKIKQDIDTESSEGQSLASGVDMGLLTQAAQAVQIKDVAEYAEEQEKVRDEYEYENDGDDIDVDESEDFWNYAGEDQIIINPEETSVGGGKERLLSPTAGYAFPNVGKTNNVTRHLKDIEAISDQAEEEFEPMDPELIRLHISELESYELGNRAETITAVQANYSADTMLQRVVEANNRMASLPGIASDPIDQVDGPREPPGSQSRRKRASRVSDFRPEEIEDSDEEIAISKTMPPVQVRRTSLNILEKTSDSKKKTVSFKSRTNDSDSKFKSAPKLLLNDSSKTSAKSSKGAISKDSSRGEDNLKNWSRDADSNSANFEEVSSKISEITTQIPVIDGIEVFTSKIDQMWSPGQKQVSDWSFFHGPPLAISPSNTPSSKLANIEIPDTNMGLAGLSYQPLNQNSSSLRPAAVQKDPFALSPVTARMINVFRWDRQPPSLSELQANWHGEPEREYRDPYFSNPSDATGSTKVFGNKRFKVGAENDLSSLDEFSKICRYTGIFPSSGILKMHELKLKFGVTEPTKPFSANVGSNLPTGWTLARGPPSKIAVKKWLALHPEDQSGSQPKKLKAQKASQLEGPTPKNKFGYKYSQIKTEALNHEMQHLVSMSVEVLTTSMTESDRVLANLPKMKLPDPAVNSILAVFYCFHGFLEVNHRSNGHRDGYHVGMIIVEDQMDDEISDPMPYRLNGISGYPVKIVSSEMELFTELVSKIREFDPDILLGYEVHLSSWGYLIERAKLQHEFDLLRELSRMLVNVKKKFGREQDQFAYKGTCAISCSGRIFLNVWRLMRSELTLTNYSLENTVFHVLHQRIPKFSPATLYSWYAAKGLKRWRSIMYFVDRVQFSLFLLEDTSLLSRSCEFARVYGIDLFSVISRGSQYKVESILSRITRPENFVQFSPTREQVRNMRAIECLPLIMEPETKFYKNPVAVFDFQSLYPSVMIGYNICFSTCLGRMRDINGAPKKFGAMELYDLPLDLVEALKDHVYITHNGVVFVKSHVREGALGRMLKEILDTRVMVKTCMKAYRSDPALLRILDARQLGLKLVANVTYGYCGASYSGRMPCAEIADSIVETGRRSLEDAMRTVKENFSGWRGTVVYGDTDSMFVELPGLSVGTAFKVYLPCVLLAKKRYVGFMFETVEDKAPIFDAKGIETVRRDGFPAMSKMVEDSLKILFRTQDMSQLKAYLYRQWDKILSNRAALNDLIIATEFKLKDYRNLPPGVALATRNIEYDKRTEPQGGERVPYIICEERNTRYSNRSFFPIDVAKNRTLIPDGKVYVRKSAQALSRIFNLIGIDIEAWFNQMPKRNFTVRFSKAQNLVSTTSARGQFKIDQFYLSNTCVVCSETARNEENVLCEECRTNRSQSTLAEVQ